MEKEIKTVAVIMMLISYLLIGTMITSTFCELETEHRTTVTAMELTTETN